MKRHPATPSTSSGFTLVEMSLVILVLMTLISVGFYGNSAFREWKLARDASESLRTIYVAQRTYLADNPTVAVTALTPALVLPYVPNNPAALPTAKSLTGAVLTARVNVSPPYMSATAGGVSGARYDPSSTTTDSLWDVGE